MTGLASGRLEGLKLEGNIDLDGVVTVALLLAELLDTVETASDGGPSLLVVKGFFVCRRRVSLDEGIKENICFMIESPMNLLVLHVPTSAYWELADLLLFGDRW